MPTQNIMPLSIHDQKTKELLKEVMVEIIVEKRDFFYEIMLEAMEEIGLANAITEGRKNDFVSEDSILQILEDRE